jgi:hypothetical protein
MSAPDPAEGTSILGRLLREEEQLIPRLKGVFSFDAAVYREIEEDQDALPGAFTVVLVTSVLIGLGYMRLELVFLGIAWALILWGLCSALVWATAALVLSRVPDFAPLLRCLGFAYAWMALSVLGFLPGIGGLIEWLAVLAWAGAVVVATREALSVTRNQVFVICVVALLVPLVLLFGVLD